MALPKAAAMSDRVFIDGSVTRIHAYVGRSTSLRSIRGASTLLAEATDPAIIDGLLSARWPTGCVSICTEAGQAESVVHLELHCRCAGCAPEDIATDLLAHLRSSAPAASLRGVWGSASTYVDFVSSAPAGSLESPAPEVDIPIFEVCERCLRGYASSPVWTADRTVEIVCLDCAARDGYGDRAGGAARRLLDRLAARFAELTLAGDLSELAAQGPATRATDGVDPGRRLKQNHLALVYIDGNRFGSMFVGARDAAEHGFSIETLSVGLGEVTWTALEAAAAAVQERNDGRILLAEPIIAAADDLCVVMPAAVAWEFVETYCSEFERGATSLRDAAAQAYAGESPIAEVVPAPTASAGLVFAHMKQPFLQSLDLAEDLLSSAKRAVSGTEATVMWIDCSREGHETPPGRRPIALSAVQPRGASAQVLRLDDETRAVLDDAAQWSTSLRRNLATIAVDTDAEPQRAVEAMKDLLRRNGHFERGTAGNAGRFWMRDFEPQLMLDILSIAEWWPA